MSPDVLKPKQEEVLNAIFEGKDVYGILPTGYEKSLIFLLPALFNDNITLDISPLVSLMLSQQYQLQEWGVRSVCLSNVSRCLKPKQEEVLNAIFEGKDVCGILPTGYGKSLIFLLPALFNDNITLVISPMVSLMLSQQYQLQEWGVRSICLSDVS
ncbi:ATP-dependent DNA helicase RecQ-like [Amphiura filiformis]|uniref:ATP-dependent DNA helicase RecQ-like n=1 Tax=Amphiura filiformis TaxID=82378 RepID=UPI003B210BE1